MVNLLSLNTSMLSSSQHLRRPTLHLTTTRTRIDPRIRAKVRETVGSAIAYLAESAPAIEEAHAPAPHPVKLPAAAVVLSSHPASEGGKRVVASPYAKKLGKELGVDLRTVVGTGPNGRIVAKDVDATASSAVEARVPRVWVQDDGRRRRVLLVRFQAVEEGLEGGRRQTKKNDLSFFR